ITALQPTTTASTASGLISSETDTVRLTMDPRGGDIVSLALAEYPVHQQRPDVPFQLLDNSAERTDTAQCGLAGRYGPDARANGRPLYQAQQTSYQLAEGEHNLAVDLRFSENGVNYTKRFTSTRGDYLIKVDHLIDNQSGETCNGGLYGQIK